MPEYLTKLKFFFLGDNGIMGFFCFVFKRFFGFFLFLVKSFLFLFLFSRDMY